MNLYDELCELGVRAGLDRLAMTRHVFENCTVENQENMVEQFRRSVARDERYAEYLQLRSACNYPTGPIDKNEWVSFDHERQSRMIKRLRARIAELKAVADSYEQQHGEVW